MKRKPGDGMLITVQREVPIDNPFKKITYIEKIFTLKKYLPWKKFLRW